MAKSSGLHIDRWQKGLVTNRAATSTPMHVGGLGGVVRYEDALIDGSNVEISPANTLVRRPGWPKYCSVTYGSETPKGFYSAIINGTLWDFFDTDTKVYTFTTSSLTSILTKGTTAQTRYQQVGNFVYFSDGTNNKKFTAGTASDTSITNAGITAPTSAPTIPNLNLYDTSGATQTVHAWVPKATYTNSTGSPLNFFLKDPFGNIQWAVVPAGTSLQSQSSAPNWAAGSGTFGAVTKDGTMTWTCCNSVGTWAANTVFTNSAYSTTNLMSSTSTTSTKGTTGSTSINWTVGSSSAGFATSSSTTGNTNTLTFTGFGLSVPAGATIKGVTVYIPRASNRANAVQDVTVKLLKAGVASGSNKAASGSWPFTTGADVYSIPTSGGITQIYGGNTDLWGTTLTPTDVANANFGVEVIANVSSTRDTSAAVVYPVKIVVSYFIAASDITGTLYAQVIQDSNGNLQRVKTGGTSGGSAPSWSSTIGGTTTDNTVTWECLGTAATLPTLFNRTYAYGFHSGDPHISTMSPTLVVQAPIIGLSVNVQGIGSNDTQVDRNDLYRSADGGSLLLYDASAPNVDASTSWTINDTALDSDLNELIVGPVAHANDPPPTGATLLAYHMGRMWAAVDNKVYFSAGPDCVNGDGNQAWPPANVFTFPGPVTGFAATTAGLVVLTAGERQIILGGPQLQTFWAQPLLKARGVINANCLAQDGDQVATYTSMSQFFGASSEGEEEFGWDAAPTLAANFSPSTSYVTIHRSGQDQGVFISNGSTKVMRFNLNTDSWDPIATPAAGIGPIASIDTAIGTRTLVGAANGFIVARDTTVFQDSGSSYAAYATVGSIVLSEPGENPAYVESILLTSAAVGTALSIGVLPNEVSGSFTNIPLDSSDPYQLPASSTINMKRYAWKGVQTALPQLVKHFQVKITMPTEAAKNEIYSMAVMPPK